MSSLMTNRRIADELMKRDLLPKDGRLIEVSIGVSGATVIRYERFVGAEEVAKVAEALRAAADSLLSEDRRMREASARLDKEGLYGCPAGEPGVQGVDGSDEV